MYLKQERPETDDFERSKLYLKCLLLNTEIIHIKKIRKFSFQNILRNSFNLRKTRTINVHKQRYANCNVYLKKQNVTKILKQGHHRP